MSKYVQALQAQQAKFLVADAAVRKFQDAAYERYDSHAYTAGYLGSKIAAMAAQYLTKTQFAEFLMAMDQAAEKQAKEVA